MALRLKNNASTTLAAALASTDTTLVVSSGTGSRFASLGTGDYFYATLQDTSNNFEIVKVTARTDDSMTIVRAQEGTLAIPFAQNSRFESRITAQSVMDFAMAAGGATTEVQFNNAGSLDGNANFTIDDATGGVTFGVDAGINGCTAGRGAGDVVDNTVFGLDALGTVNTGDGNTVFGAYNLIANTTGSSNTVVGNGCMVTNTGGSDNTVVGYAAGENITGGENVVVGRSAGAQITSGLGNLVLGHAAGGTTTGDNNLELLTITPSSGTPIFNTLTNSHRIVMGNDDHTNAYIKVAWTVTSDARDKTSFAPVPHGLAFVQALRPMAYRFRTSREDATPTGPVRYGFLAQDILALEGSNSVVVDAEDANSLKYNEAAMVSILVKAVQELKAEFDAYRLAHP